MALYFYLGLIAISVFVALRNWRHGYFMLILVGSLQDPVRKAVPGTPAWLVMATLPVWAAVLPGFANEAGIYWREFRLRYRRMAVGIVAFLACLVGPALMTVSYGRDSWQLAVIGGISYLSPVAGILVGFAFPTDLRDIERLAGFYCVLAAAALTGTAAEHMGLFSGSALLGTEVLGGRWVRHIPGVQVRLLSGFFRSPDVMGWHAAMLAMLATALAMHAEGARRRLFWALLAGWGTVGALLSGRRKMFMMLGIFVATLAVAQLARTWRERGRAGNSIMVTILALAMGAAIYARVGPSESVQAYYLEYDLDPVFHRIRGRALDAVVTTYRQHGLLGAGLGTATQGTQHVDCERPRTWQEGGVSRVMVELGAPGLAVFLYLSLVFVLASFRVFRSISTVTPGANLYAGLGALVFANGGNYVVSHQVFGDPFITCFLSLLVGMFLSRVRLREEPPPEAADGPPVAGAGAGLCRVAGGPEPGPSAPAA